MYYISQGITMDERTKHLMIAEHFNYEVEQMFFAANELANFGDPMKNILLFNTFLEAWVLHFRNITEFLYRKSSKWEDQTLAIKYVRYWFSDNICPKIRRLLENGWSKADKQIAHLSSDRVKIADAGNKPWQYKELTLQLIDTINLFYDQIRDDYPDTYRGKEQRIVKDGDGIYFK